MRANWVKRVLFLADRVALVRQAHNNFKKHLPSAPSANLIEKHDPKKKDHNGARVCVATYPTMMKLIVDYLTESGAMEPRRLYESPFTDFDDQGVSGVFPQADRSGVAHCA